MAHVSVTQEDGLALVGFDRPQKRNALDLATVRELHAALDAAARQPCVVLFYSTTPGVFVSGADIAELRERTAEDALQRINGSLFDRIASHRWPTIAAIDGPALGGGCELALACDFRVVSDRIRFAQPEPRLGILAAAGGNWRLERLAGLSLARRMLLAGDSVAAAEALASGLADVVVEPGEVMESARELADRVRRASWQALELTKKAMALGAPQRSSEFDAPAQALLFESDEKKARMDAFLNRPREERS